MTWLPGTPKEKGIYWFDTGFNIDKHYLVAQYIRDASNTYVYGHHGSMPISMVYSPKVSKKARYKKIKPPSGKWVPFKKIGSARYAWVKSPEGYIGFCFFNLFSVIWETNPYSRYEGGGYMHPKYLYQAVELP